jgi:hypothetical protein
VVVVLSLLTLGFYWPIWFGQTWSELKRVVRDPGMSPVGHTLSLAVPIYSLFRIGAHYRTINEQSTHRGLPRSIGPGGAASGIALANLLSAIGIGQLLIAVIIASGQRALNRLWESEFGPASRRGASAGEWVTISALVILVGFAAVSLVSNPSTARQFKYQVGDCRGWQDVQARLTPINDDIDAFWTDVNGTVNPDADDVHRWASAARSIRQQYDLLPHPAALNRFVALSSLTYGDYDLGFGAMANGDFERGRALVQQGDDTLSKAITELDMANAQCVA